MSGLAFGNYFECNAEQNYDKFIYGVRPVVQFVFTFGQLYFVFLHSKVRSLHFLLHAVVFVFLHSKVRSLHFMLHAVVFVFLHSKVRSLHFLLHAVVFVFLHSKVRSLHFLLHAVVFVFLHSNVVFSRFLIPPCCLRVPSLHDTIKTLLDTAVLSPAFFV